MARVNPDGTFADDCSTGPHWKDVPPHEGGAMRAVRMWFWDLLYHMFTHLSVCCSARYIKAKYGTYPAWYGKGK